MRSLPSDARPRRDKVTRRALVFIICIAVIAVACSSDTDDPDLPGVYVAVIRSLAPDVTATMPKVVYVESPAGKPLSLEQQTKVVKAFGNDTAVRFIDERTEAIDDGQPQSPVRRDGVLLEMNPSASTSTGATIRTTRYATRDDERTVCIDLQLRAQVWEVAHTSDC